MLSVAQQIAEGRLVCPVTHQRLRAEGDSLRSADGRFFYALKNGVPILLDADKQAVYLEQFHGHMQREYTVPKKRSAIQDAFDRLVTIGGDRRNPRAVAAFNAMFGKQPPGALCLSVGGGPTRAHPMLVNLNLDLFPNVDVVGDVYTLPYADNAVDVIHCEAVLEHLEYPDRAVAEMFRVMKPTGRLFCATPFLQWFHGFPNHFQNFTLYGHERIFLRAGFGLIAMGVCVGPVFALTELLTRGGDFLPGRWLRAGARPLLRLFAAAVRPLDRRIIARNPSAHLLASTTFVYAMKPYPLPS